MTEAAFRAVALRAIQAGAPLFGVYFLDHADGTLYCVTRWLNAPLIACDEYWPTITDACRVDYLRAFTSEETRHWPRWQ